MALENNEWEGLPPLGARVLVPHGRTTIEGEVVLLYRLFGRPRARVRVELHADRGPDEAHYVNVLFGPGELDVISEVGADA